MSKPSTISKPSSTKAAAELWEAIKTIISLQNQAPPLVAVSRDEPLPLSFTQERLWFLDRLTGSNSAYNIPFALLVRGDLDTAALERSFQEIIQRHEALRTNFVTEADSAIQSVAERAEWQLTIKQLPPDSVAERQATIERLCQEEAQQPFDLGSDSLLRATLIKLGSSEDLLLITVHHIVFDGWSEGVFWRELAALYQAFSTKQASPLTPLPVQYGDVAVWQRQWLQGELLEHLLAYWRGQLQGLRELELPIARPRTSSSTRPSASHKQILPAPLTTQLKTLSRQEGATLFALLLAAFNVLLSRYTEQDDLFVCSPIANRNRKELKNLIGYFVNLLILRSDLKGNPNFRDLLGQVRQTVSGAYAHQDLPLQQLVNNIDLGQTPLSQVMFVLQNTANQSPELADLTVESLDIDNGTADFELSLSLTETEGTLIGVWKYNRDLFTEEAIAKMQARFQLLLEQIVADPAQHLDALLVLNDGDRQELRQQRANYRRVPKVAKREWVKPRNPLELQLLRVWERILATETERNERQSEKAPALPHLRPFVRDQYQELSNNIDGNRLGVRDNFFEVGGNSLLAFRLIAEIEKTFGKKLPLTALLQAPTIEKLAEILRQESDTASCSWLTPKQPDSSRQTFFCIAPAGNSGIGFAQLVAYLGSDQPFYVPQALGLEGEAAPHNRVEDMAAHYIQEIRKIQPQGPYLLGGRCFGGVVAFEMALQLSRQGQKVALLALIDGTMPPHLYLKLRNRDGSKRKKSLAEFWQSFAFFYKNGRLLTLLKYKYEKRVRKFQKRRAQRQKVADHLMENVQKVFRSHLQARANYVPEGTYPGKIDIYASGTLRTDQQDKWSELATGGIEYHFVGGEHGTIDREPHVQILAAKLRDSIDRASKPST